MYIHYRTANTVIMSIANTIHFTMLNITEKANLNMPLIIIKPKSSPMAKTISFVMKFDNSQHIATVQARQMASFMQARIVCVTDGRCLPAEIIGLS